MMVMLGLLLALAHSLHSNDIVFVVFSAMAPPKLYIDRDGTQGVLLQGDRHDGYPPREMTVVASLRANSSIEPAIFWAADATSLLTHRWRWMDGFDKPQAIALCMCM